MLDRFLEKYPAESVLFHIDCTALLASGETITGTPTMSALPALTGAGALTFGAVTVNTEAVTYADGVVAQAGKAIQVRIGGGDYDTGVPSRIYSVMAACTTSAGNTVVARAALRVLNPQPGY